MTVTRERCCVIDGALELYTFGHGLWANGMDTHAKRPQAAQSH